MKHTLLDSVDQMTKSLNHKLPFNYINILNIWIYSCTIWNIVIYSAFQMIWIQSDYEEAIISFDYPKIFLAISSMFTMIDKKKSFFPNEEWKK
jgi:hypothetical protein